VREITALSERVLAQVIQYLGPASKRFLERQTQFHLNGLDFDKLELTHIPELAKWVEISAQLIVDKGKAEELAEKIRKIS